MEPCRDSAFDGDVDLWSFDLVYYQPTGAAEAVLSEGERLRAQRIGSVHARARYVAGRAMLRRILSEYVGRPAVELVIEHAKRGKPYLPAHPQLGFNLAHSGERAVLAVGPDRRVGVDIENPTRTTRFDAIARRFFAPEECEWLMGAPVCERPDRFFRIWTCKEAFGKALGSGLSLTPQAHALAFQDPGSTRVLRTTASDERSEAWRFETRVVDGFVVSLCADVG